jgi:hypothetical protein
VPFVTLNSRNYYVERVQQVALDPLSQAIRLSGQNRRPDNRFLDFSVYDNHANMGIGWRRMRRGQDPPRGIGGIWKSTSETRFPSCMYNAMREVSQTHVAPLDHVKRYMNYASDFWGIFENDYSTSAVQMGVSGLFANPSTFSVAGSAQIPTISTHSTSDTTNAASITRSHTVQSTHGNTIIVAVIATSDSSAASPTGVTYAGSAMTRLITENESNLTIDIWYRVAPASGSNNCVASWSPTMDSIAISVADYYFVDQSTPFRGSGSSTSSASEQSLALSLSLRKGDLAIGGFGHRNTGAITPGTGQTEWVEVFVDGTGSSDVDFNSSYERVGATSASFDHSYSTNAAASRCVVVGDALRAPNGVINFSASLTAGSRIFDITTHKGLAWAIGNRGNGDELKYMVWSSPDMLAWTEPGNTGWPTGDLLTTTITRRNTFNDDWARIADDGNTLWAFIRDDANNEIEVLTSTDEGANWTAEFQIPSADGPKGVALFFDRTGARRVMLATVEGIYSLDQTNNIFTLEQGLDGQVANGRWMTVGDDGNLYCPLAEDDLLQISLGQQVGEGIFQWNAIRIGPMSAHDGLPAEWRGHMNYIMSGNSIGGVASQWLFVLYGGHASSTTATIMAYDYKRSRDMGHPIWHCVHDVEENAISGMGQNVDLTMMGYSAEDDATPRLHVAAEHATSALMFDFVEPLVCHVDANVSSTYITDTFVRYAEDDHGDPHSGGALFQGRIDPIELDTTANNQEKVSHFFSINGTDPPATDLGDYFLELLFSSGLGISCRTSTHELRLIRGSGDTSERAVVRAFDVGYAKKLDLLDGWVMSIDLARSVEVESNFNDTEDVIAALDTVRDTTLQVPFSIGRATSVNVRAIGDQWTWDLELVPEGGGEGNQLGMRTGTANIVIAQRLS